MTTGIVFYLMTASLASALKVFHIHLIVNGSEQRLCRMIRIVHKADEAEEQEKMYGLR